MVNPPGGQLGYDSRGGHMDFGSPARGARSMVGDSPVGSPYSGRTAPMTSSPAGMQQMQQMQQGGQGSPSQGFGICCGREEQGARPPPWDPNKLSYVGERRGTYRRVVQYEYVGDGMGDFDMPIESVPESSSCCSAGCCCCLLVLCALAAGLAACWHYEWPVPISQVAPPLAEPLLEALGLQGLLGGGAALVDCAANGTAPSETEACCNRTAGLGLGCSENDTTTTEDPSSTVDAAQYCKDLSSFTGQSDMKAWCCKHAAIGCTAANSTVSGSIGAAKSAAAGATKWVSGSTGTQPGLSSGPPKAAGVVDEEAPDDSLGAAARSANGTTTEEAPANNSWGTVWTDAEDQASTEDNATALRQKVTIKTTTTTTPRTTETSSLTTTEDATANCYKKGEWSPETQKICCEALSIGCAFSDEPSDGGEMTGAGHKKEKVHRRRR